MGASVGCDCAAAVQLSRSVVSDVTLSLGCIEAQRKSEATVATGSGYRSGIGLSFLYAKCAS